ncbi:MAG TPA: hypothetical protein VGI61_06310 [Parafilimonas sp.]
MTDDKNKTTEPAQTSNDTNNSGEEQALPVKNPFNENDNKKITQQDLESEQEFKEAQTERD